MKNCQGPGCKNRCFEKEAIENKDFTLCSNIDNSTETDGVDSGKAYCEGKVAAATLNLDNCKKITYGSDSNKEFATYDCYLEIAKSKKDISICENIPKAEEGEGVGKGGYATETSEEYKKRQAAKTRELDRKIKQLNRQLAEQRSPPEQVEEGARYRQHWLPWLLLALSWAGFVGYLWWSRF